MESISEQADNTSSSTVSSVSSQKIKVLFVALAFGFFTLIAGGLVWAFFLSGDKAPVGGGWFLFSYTMGLSMIVLPCTLPLAFVIVPLSMGKGYIKGLVIAVAFGAGVAITLSMYGILAALLGRAIFDFAGGGGETVKNIFYAIAGVFAILFALGELGFLKFKIPSYTGAVPSLIQKQSAVLKAFFLGLFMGNIGVGCPHPATPIILGQIGIVGNVFYGWLLFFIHALGRVMPLIFLAILGILGVNALAGLVKHKESIAKATAWSMVFIGGFLFTLGFFSHDWWVYSGTHTLFEQIVQEERLTNIISGQLNAAPAHRHGFEELMGKTGFFGLPLWLGSWIMVALWLVPIWWYWLCRKKEAKVAPESERILISSKLKWMGGFFVSLSLLLFLLFGHALPNWFLLKVASMQGAIEVNDGKKLNVIACMAAGPYPLQVNTPAELSFTFLEEGDCREPETYKYLGNIGIEHERIMHVLIVDEALEVFMHLHPEDFGPITQNMIDKPRFAVNYMFSHEGAWRIVAQILHQNHTITKSFNLALGDNSKPVSIVKDLSIMKNFGGYDIKIEPKSKIIAGKQISINYNFQKDSQPVADLKPYLGAAAHFAIWSIDLASFAHEHGVLDIDAETGEEHHGVINIAHAHGDENESMTDDNSAEHELPSSFGPDVKLMYTFPYPGLYKIFGQFKRGTEIITTEFMVIVDPSEHEIMGQRETSSSH